MILNMERVWQSEPDRLYFERKAVISSGMNPVDSFTVGILGSTRAVPDSPAYTFRPPPEGPHKSMTFQHGCPHHWKPPDGMYFYNTSTTITYILELLCNIKKMVLTSSASSLSSAMDQSSPSLPPLCLPLLLSSYSGSL